MPFVAAVATGLHVVLPHVHLKYGVARLADGGLAEAQLSASNIRRPSRISKADLFAMNDLQPKDPTSLSDQSTGGIVARLRQIYQVENELITQTQRPSPNLDIRRPVAD